MISKGIYVLYTGGKEILSPFRICNQNFATYYRKSSTAHSLYTTFWPKNRYFGHSLPSYGSWNQIYLTDSWRMYKSRPSAQFVAWLGHFWQFYSDFSMKKRHFSPKKAKFRHYDVIVGQNTNNENFYQKTIHSPFIKDHFAKKSKFIAFFVQKKKRNVHKLV